MTKLPLLQTENRVWRTYRGGRNIDLLLGKPSVENSAWPEDWISSFVEAKNRNYIPGEGISRVLIDGKEVSITQAVAQDDFGPGRSEAGVLIKLLDAAERLGIQVHPTPAFSRSHFGTDYGKTECWHILGAEPGAAVYIGFREGISREKWQSLFERQDVPGMLRALHRLEVTPGDTILVRAGTPHAIGAGCFLLEIQEPCDYTMRAETTTVAGQRLTDMQISYGLGQEALLDCFCYEGLTEVQARERFLLKPRKVKDTVTLVSYEDTPCFALDKITGKAELRKDCFSTLVALEAGTLYFDSKTLSFQTGDKIFIPYGCGSVSVECGAAMVCYPPKRGRI